MQLADKGCWDYLQIVLVAHHGQELLLKHA